MFNRPFGIAKGQGGSFYIADTGTSLILATLPHSNLCLTRPELAGNHSIRQLDSRQVVNTVLGAGRELRTGEQPLLSPMGVCVDGTNCLYLSEWGANRIRRVSPDGSSIIVAGSTTKVSRVRHPAAGKHMQCMGSLAQKHTWFVNVTGKYRGCRDILTGAGRTLSSFIPAVWTWTAEAMSLLRIGATIASGKPSL